MRRKAPPQRHPLVQISRGRDPEEAVQVRRRGALVRAHQSRRLLVRRAHVQLLEHRLSLMPRQVAVGTELVEWCFFLFRTEFLISGPTVSCLRVKKYAS